MSLTRFFDRQSGIDGPVSGGIATISVGFDDVANSETVHRRVAFPAGMAFEISSISVYSGTVTSDPQITVGSTAAGTQVVATVSVTATLGALTIKEGTIAAGGFIDVRVVADSGDAAENISVTIVGHNTAAPTTMLR